MSDPENVWEGRTAGVKVVRTSLLLRLSEGEDVEQLLEEMKGSYSKKLKGWLLDYRSLIVSTFGSSDYWVEVQGDFAVYKPLPGLQISTTFMRVEDGQALCGVLVRVIYIRLLTNFIKMNQTLSLEITQYLKAGECGWEVYVEGMSEDELEGLEHGQDVVVR